MGPVPCRALRTSSDWMYERQRSHLKVVLGKAPTGRKGDELDEAGGQAQWKREGSNDNQRRAGSKPGRKRRRAGAC